MSYVLSIFLMYSLFYVALPWNYFFGRLEFNSCNVKLFQKYANAINKINTLHLFTLKEETRIQEETNNFNCLYHISKDDHELITVCYYLIVLIYGY